MSSSKFKVGDSLIVNEKGGKTNVDLCSYSCLLCDKVYQKRNSYNYHMRTKHSTAMVQTVLTTPTSKKIKSPFPSTKQLMNEPNQSDSYPCDQCEKTYKFVFSLTRHVQNHHSVKQSSGKKRVKATSKLREDPASLVTVDPSFRCDFCPQVFDSQERRNGHFERVHMPLIKKAFANKVKKAPDVLPKFKCKICQKKFMFQKSLTVHIKTHSEKSQELPPLAANNQIYVDGETQEPIIKVKKNGFNPNIERRKVIHRHAETHRLDDPDYVVVATNDFEEEFRMKSFDEETNQHYVCKPFHDEDSDDEGRGNDANFPPEIVQSCMEILTSSSVEDFEHGGGCALLQSPLFIFQEIIPFEQNLTRDTNTEDRKMINEVIEDLLENVAQAAQKTPFHQVSSGEKSDNYLVGVIDDRDDAGNEADCSNMDTSSDIVSDDFTSNSNEAFTRPNKYSTSKCYTKKIPVLKEPSTNLCNPAKEYSNLKKPICSSPLPRVTSSPRVISCSPKLSPLITGVGDCPKGNLAPVKQHSPPLEAALYRPQYQSTSQPHQTFPPPRGIHPLLLPLYTQNPPPTQPPINTSPRNMNNLISVFIHGRSAREEGGNY